MPIGVVTDSGSLKFLFFNRFDKNLDPADQNLIWLFYCHVL